MEVCPVGTVGIASLAFIVKISDLLMRRYFLEKKQISTSIRFPDDVYNYVDSLPGRSFSRKLIGLIRDDMNGTSNRRKCVDELNDLILDSRVQLQSHIVTLQDQINYINDQVSLLEKSINHFLDLKFLEYGDPPEVEYFVPPEMNDELPFN